MLIQINDEDLIVKIAAKMEANLKAQARTQGLDEEEVQATFILNRKKIAEDAAKLEDFFKSMFSPVEETPAE